MKLTQLMSTQFIILLSSDLLVRSAATVKKAFVQRLKVGNHPVIQRSPTIQSPLIKLKVFIVKPYVICIYTKGIICTRVFKIKLPSAYVA